MKKYVRTIGPNNKMSKVYHKADEMFIGPYSYNKEKTFCGIGIVEEDVFINKRPHHIKLCRNCARVK